jgi:hypothetical protein
MRVQSMHARRIGMSTARILAILRGSNMSEEKITHPSKMFTGLGVRFPAKRPIRE